MPRPRKTDDDWRKERHDLVMARARLVARGDPDPAPAAVAKEAGMSLRNAERVVAHLMDDVRRGRAADPEFAAQAQAIFRMGWRDAVQRMRDAGLTQRDVMRELGMPRRVVRHYWRDD